MAVTTLDKRKKILAPSDEKFIGMLEGEL